MIVWIIFGIIFAIFISISTYLVLHKPTEITYKPTDQPKDTIIPYSKIEDFDVVDTCDGADDTLISDCFVFIGQTSAPLEVDGLAYESDDFNLRE